MGTGSGAYELNHECASKSYLITRTGTSKYTGTDVLFLNFYLQYTRKRISKQKP